MDDDSHIHRFSAQRKHPSREPGDVQQIVNQSGYMVDLPDDGLHRPRKALIVAIDEFQYLRGITYGRERITKLVSQYGKKLILALVRVTELLFSILVVLDIDARPDKADKLIVLESRFSDEAHPVIGAVCLTKP